MREDIFDTYLRSILDKSDVKGGSADKPKEGSAPAAEEEKPQESEPLPTNEAMPIELPDVIQGLDDPDGGTKDFDIKKLRESTQKNKNPEAERPVHKRRKRVRHANYSAYGGIVLATLVLCTSIVISLFVIVVGRDFLGIDTNNNEFTLYIEENWGISNISDYLYENGIIEYPKLFTQFAKLIVGDGSVYPGDIDVSPAMSYNDIIDSLTTMREAHPTVRVTFPEGSTIDDCAKILEENEICDADEFIFAFNSNVYGFDFESHVSSSGLKYYKYEGYLFPDTYDFYVGDSVYNIVRKIKERTDEIMNADLISRCQESGHTLEEIVTMASLLEKESGVYDEMRKIASVFYNRLNSPDVYPMLQSDTTSRYIKNVIKAGATVDFQEMCDAYDTYVCNGLPVGPICNPGKDAIEAALNPEDTPYYFFLSSPETNEFYYAETYAEHKENEILAGLDV